DHVVQVFRVRLETAGPEGDTGGRRDELEVDACLVVRHQQGAGHHRLDAQHATEFVHAHALVDQGDHAVARDDLEAAYFGQLVDDGVVQGHGKQALVLVTGDGANAAAGQVGEGQYGDGIGDDVRCSAEARRCHLHG